MTSAGIDTTIFKPHSTRAAATSMAKTASVPIQEILKTAVVVIIEMLARISFMTNLWNPPHLLLLFSRLFGPEIGLVGKWPFVLLSLNKMSYRKRLYFKTFMFLNILMLCTPA